MSRTLNSWVFYRRTGGSDRKYAVERRSTYTGFFDTTVLAGIGPVGSSPLGSNPFIWVLTTRSSSSLRCWKKWFVVRLRAHDASPSKGTRAAVQVPWTCCCTFPSLLPVTNRNRYTGSAIPVVQYKIEIVADTRGRPRTWGLGMLRFGQGKPARYPSIVELTSLPEDRMGPRDIFTYWAVICWNGCLVLFLTPQ